MVHVWLRAVSPHGETTAWFGVNKGAVTLPTAKDSAYGPPATAAAPISSRRATLRVQRSVPLMTMLFKLMLLDPGMIRAALASTQEDAGALATEVRQALGEADSVPHCGVDAATDTVHAPSVYKRLGLEDQVCELQANTSWCTKRRDTTDLQVHAFATGA